MENNGLIAKFMGQKKNKNGKYDIPKHPYEYHWMGNSYDYFPENMRYDQSWDWLMPVVKKIKDIAEEFEYDTFNYSAFESIFDIDMTCSDFMNNNIEGIYERCTEFIEWYNKEIKDA